MGDVPVPRSFNQILGDMLDTFLSKQGVSNLRVGSPLLSLLEAGAQSDTRSSQDILQLLNSISIDKATGLALRNAGAEEKVPQQSESPASGTVTISDTSFTKKSSKLFQGSPAPIAGSVAIDVIDASAWPASGSVFLGRGTPNYEGPLAYASKTNAGTHWTLNLASGTVKFHNTSETAVLAQGGNRQIGVGAIVRTPQANIADAVQFKVVYARTIPDGETEITGVLVQAMTPGTIGNVPAKAIKEFVSSPFTGAAVTNPSPFSNGLATETDEDYRERVKSVRRTRARGTPLAIKTAVTGITASDENKRISSAELVTRQNTSTLYIDDGTGYEERTAGVAMESLVDSALGGEQYFELGNRPVARAFVESTNDSPFNLAVGSALTVKIGGVAYIHSFSASSFVSMDNATAYEVAASINSDSNLAYLARTADSGTKVVLFAKVDTNEDIEVVATDGVDANDALGFQLDINYTARPYLNDRLLSKDGSLATYASQSFSLWNVVSGSQTLTVAVDGTPATTYTFVDQDFVNAVTGFSAVGRNSAAAWVGVINAKIPGLTASDSGGRIVLTSNLGTSSRASVAVTGGSLISAHFFTAGMSVGSDRDYTLDRNTSQLRLEKALSPGDRLTIGSVNTRAFVESGVIGTTAVTSTAKLWFVVDGAAEILANGVNAAMTFTIAPTALHAWGSYLAVTAGSGAPFANAVAGDWLVLWDPALDVSLHGAHRIVTATGTALTVERRTAPVLRSGHRSVALTPVGSAVSKVLTCGGSLLPKPDLTPSTTAFAVTDTVEIFDPNTNRVTFTAPMSTPRAYHTATLLANGKVLVTGGVNDANALLASIELYDPSTGLWTVSGAVLGTAVKDHAATLLQSGKVLITGGNSGVATGITAAWVYDPGADTITATGNTMGAARARHRQVLLPSGVVLVAGGFNGSGTDLASCELFTPGTTLFSSTGAMTRARSAFGLAHIAASANKVLAIGNTVGATGRNSYEVYSISGGTWGSETTIPNGLTVEHNNAITMSNGKVVVLHGWGTGPIPKATQYDGTTWTALPVSTLRTESAAKFDVQYVNLTKLDSSLANSVLAIGGMQKLSNVWGFTPTAQYEGYDGTGQVWSVPDPASTASVTFSKLGLALVRSAGLVRGAEVPVGTNYTASSIVTQLNDALVGATASTYRTNQLRMSTNTFDRSGNFALVAQNTFASGLRLTSGSAIRNLTGHLGSVESSNSEIGTPSFQDLRIRGTTAPVTADLEPLVLDTTSVPVDYGVVGLRNFWDGSPGTGGYAFASFSPTMGDNTPFRTRLKQANASTITSKVTPRSVPTQPWKALDRVYLAAPYALGPNDDLSVVVNNDSDSRYSMSMGRRLATVGNTYSSSNVFKDAGAGGASIAATFGLNYSFDDMAVYMPARAVAFNSTPTAKLLFRYFRLGPEGNGVRVRFANPEAPGAAVKVAASFGSTATADVRIKLAGGSLRAATVHTGMNVGVACVSGTGTGLASLVYVLNLPIASATRTSNATVLTLTLPSGITDHGLAINDAVWVASTNGSFGSGLKTITARSATTITYAETAADAGPSASIGTVSNDATGESTFTGAGVLTGDFLRIVNADSTFDTAFANNTVSITGATAGSVTTYSGETPALDFTPVTTLSWQPLGANANFQAFANPANTASQIVTAVNALAAVTNSTVPVTMTLLGAGSATITQSTTELLGDTTAWYTLTDGVNWVSSTTAPGSVAGDYTLVFKNPIAGLLATNADWQNEVVVVGPTTAKNVVDWLSTPTISGLFTACSIQASSDGAKVQIVSRTPGSAGGVQVQGGAANASTAAVQGTMRIVDGNNFAVSTVRRADAAGFKGGHWCTIANTVPMPKVLTVGSLVSWGDDGLVVFGTTNALAVATLVPTKIKVRIERQGDFVAISDMGVGGTVALDALEPGAWLRLTPTVSPTADMPQISSANQGIFRILRVAAAAGGDSNGTLWFQNAEAIEEAVECELAAYSPDSVMPGDTFVVSTTDWGVDNQGTWTVRSVGNTTAASTDYFNAGVVDLGLTDRLTVDITSRTPANVGPGSFSANPDLVKFVEGTPATFSMKVVTIVPNQTDGTFMDIGWDKPVFGSTIGAAAGSIITVRDKLAFPLAFSAGVDGYAYDVGLIGEANRVVYGDPGDTSTYPGWAAAGAQIAISGPLVKRIRLALSLRIRSGVTNSDIADRVRSTVATLINQSGIGEAIALSDVVAAASKVVGVVAVTVVSPAYGVGNDLVSIAPYEKALILSLENDIQVSFVAE